MLPANFDCMTKNSNSKKVSSCLEEFSHLRMSSDHTFKQSEEQQHDQEKYEIVRLVCT